MNIGSSIADLTKPSALVKWKGFQGKYYYGFVTELYDPRSHKYTSMIVQESYVLVSGSSGGLKLILISNLEPVE